MKNAILLYKPSHRFSLDIQADLDVILEGGIDWASWQDSGDEPHCHAACYNAAKKEVVEAMLGIGVRVRPVGDAELATVDVIWYDPAPEEESALAWLYAQKGKPYADIDLLHFLGRIDDKSPIDSRFFCSMLASEWRFRTGNPLFVRQQFFKTPPGLIYISRVGTLGAKAQPC